MKFTWDLANGYLTKQKIDQMLIFMPKNESERMHKLKNDWLTDWRAEKTVKTAGEVAIAELMFLAGYLAAHTVNGVNDDY